MTPTLRKLAVAVVATAAILFTVFIFWVFHLRHTNMLDDHARLWRSKGWPVGGNQIYPSASTHDQCEPWITICGRTGSTRSGELGEFYDDIEQLSWSLDTALATGDDLGQLILDRSVAANDNWQAMSQLNRDAVAAAEQCPSLQWFDPAEYAGRLDLPIPDLLGLMRWSGSMSIEATQLAAAGQIAEAEELLFLSGRCRARFSQSRPHADRDTDQHLHGAAGGNHADRHPDHFPGTLDRKATGPRQGPVQN